MSFKWLPNLLTALRILAAPLVGMLVWLATAPASVESVTRYAGLAFLIFSLACLTDWLDGFLARALNATSDLGAKMDLWADKIIVAAVLIGMVPTAPLVAGIGLFSLTIRDLFIMYLRARHKGVNLKASVLAKSKTAIVMIAMAAMMLGWYFSFAFMPELGDPRPRAPFILIGGGLALLSLGCGLSLYTGYQYVHAVRQSSKAAPLP